jgi:hypothetical protein
LKIQQPRKCSSELGHKDFAAQHPSKLRFENTIAKKMLKRAWTFSWLLYLFVTATGLFSNQTISFLENLIQKIT